MNREVLYQNLMETMEQKIPADKSLVNLLTEILQIEKDAVYRRINGKVPFSFFELATISKCLDISLDHIVSSDYSKSRPSRLLINDSIDPTAHYYIILEEVVNILRSAKDKKGTEGSEATNNLPQPLYLMYDNISKFFLFKWKYQYEAPDKKTPYREVVISDKLRKLQLENVKVNRYLSEGNYIFDDLLFYHLISEIRLFMSNGLISDEDWRLIKADLLRILDDICTLSKAGHYEDSGNAINIYVSNTNIPTSYCYIKTPEQRVSLIKAFSLNGIISVDKDTFDKLKHWTDSLKRQSTLISGAGEKERIQFIDKQYSIIETI